MNRRIAFHVVTLFPEAIQLYCESSILQRAQSKKIISIDLVQLRAFAIDRRSTVDDTPYGGGPGMVLKADPIHKAVQAIKNKIGKRKNRKLRTILFSTRGAQFDQKSAKRLAKYDDIIMICGRYEGVDERVARYLADEEISIGPYILSGGELPALVVLEAVSRHRPGVLGKQESLEETKGSYPVYTRPPVLSIMKNGRRRKFPVPGVLLSGDHAKIALWRRDHGARISESRPPRRKETP